MRIIMGVCGASGVNYSFPLLRELKKKKVETHLIVSEWAEELVRIETGKKISDLKKLASYSYREKEMDAHISSSSFLCDGMVVVPASVKTVAQIANADTGTLISRCADIMLRTGKKLIVCVRETPLSAPALKNLYNISLYGGTVMPLSPAFYHMPKKIEDLEKFISGKIMDLLGIKNNAYKRWKK